MAEKKQTDKAKGAKPTAAKTERAEDGIKKTTATRSAAAKSSTTAKSTKTTKAAAPKSDSSANGAAKATAPKSDTSANGAVKATAKKTTSTTASKKSTPAKAAQVPTTERKKMATEAKSDTTAQKAASATKKEGTGDKKTATGAKKATAKRQSTAKAKRPQSSNTSAHNTQDQEDTQAAKEQTPLTEEAPAIEIPLIRDLPTAIPQRELVKDGDREISNARPGVDFPRAMRQSFFVRLAFLLVVVIVLAASAFIYHHRPAVYTEKTSSVNFLYRAAGDETVILVNGTARGSVTGTVQKTLFSGRGDVCAAVIGGDLFLIRGKRITQMAPDVLDFTLSADGDAVAYRTKPANLYYAKTGKNSTPSLISKECHSAAYCLSANGQELAYTALDEAGRAQMRVESYSGNRPYIENVVGFSPVAVSDKCRYIYYTDENGALFIFESKTASKIKCATAPDPSSLIFNRDFTELLFTENGGTVFYANGARQQIVGAVSTEYLQLLPNRRVASRTLTGGMQYMVNSFYKNYFLHRVGTGQQLTYLDQKGNLRNVSFVDDVSTVTVTDKGVYFLLTNVNNENVHRVLWHAPRGKTVTHRVDWDVSSYCTNIDGSRVLYTGYEEALYTYRAETGSLRLCDSIKRESLTVTGDDLFCFYLTDGVLAVSDNGGELRELATGVVDFTVDTHVLYYCTAPAADGSFTVYVNYRNERLSDLVLDGVTAIQ